MNPHMSNYSPVSASAIAATKGLPRRMMNQIERNKSRLPAVIESRRRATNYRAAVVYIRQVYKGLVIFSEEFGKGKNRSTHIFVISPNTAATAFCLMRYKISFRDPTQDDYRELAIDIPPHVVHRIFQRYAGTDMSKALVILFALILIPAKIKKSGTWEMGTGNGLFVVQLEHGDSPNAKVKTWIDADKLRPEQSIKVGETRRIG